MYQVQKVRQGFVKIHRCPNGKYRFSGLNVIGRDRHNQVANRLVWLHHKAPDWIRELCNDYADTNFQVEVQVTQLHGPSIALVIPVAQTKEQAVSEYEQRYGCKIADTTMCDEDGVQLVDTAFENAFKAHEYAAKVYRLDVLEHVKAGLLSYTKAKRRNDGKPCKLIGGMLINKVSKVYNPDDPSWGTALRAFVRVKNDQ